MARGAGCSKHTQETARPRGEARPLPVVELDTVYHVGTLDPADKGTCGSTRSYEGHALSVSSCPAAWERIARIGGSWWELHRPAGAFLNAHELEPEQRQQIADWAVEHGLARRARCFTVSRYDADFDDERAMSFSSRREAIEEAVDVIAEDNPEEPTARELINRVGVGETLTGLEPLDRLLGFSAGEDCFDYCLLAYVETERPELDGVWWWDSYGYLSAPRGGILPRSLRLWERRELDGEERAELEWVGEEALG